MKTNKTVKVMAILALLGIIVSVIGTGILILTSGKQEKNLNQNIVSDKELRKILPNTNINLGTGTINNK